VGRAIHPALAHGVHSSIQRFLHEFVDADGNFSLRPEKMVFNEKPSTLVDANGKKITYEPGTDASCK